MTSNPSCYIRVPFTVDDPSAVDSLELLMQYDDGFVAYLNGVKIAEANAPVSPSWNSSATSSHSDPQAIVYQSFDATAFKANLVASPAENILAIHGMNQSAGSSDFLIGPALRTGVEKRGWIKSAGDRHRDDRIQSAVQQSGRGVHRADQQQCHRRRYFLLDPEWGGGFHLPAGHGDSCGRYALRQPRRERVSRKGCQPHGW